MTDFDTDTIVAQATPPGRGGVGVIRISGSKVKAIAQAILNQIPPPRLATYLPFLQHDNTVIDMGLAIYFAAPHSFTGEDIVELQGHGGQIVMNNLIERIVNLGARLAKPGEFSERAFLNGKIDLIQAEAIADLIDSASKQAAQSAIRSLQGEFSKKINHLVEQIIQLRIYIEAALDFPDEEVEFLTQGHVQQRLNNIIQQVEEVLVQAQQGTILREGKTIVIAGKPNVGKSSLLNQLSGRDSAIVTEVAGTTRDVMREYIQIDGIPLHIIDTAGLRQSKNKIEQEGIRRAEQEIKKSDHVLLLTDCREDFSIDEIFSQRNLTIVRNKIDLISTSPSIKREKNFTVISISAKTGEGINLLRQHIKNKIGVDTTIESTFIARSRHLEAIKQAKSALLQADSQLNSLQAADLFAEDLRQAQLALNEITGQFTTEDLLTRIFSSFCIGK